MQKNLEKKSKKRWYKKWWGILIAILGGLLIVFAIVVAAQSYYYYRQIKSGKMPLPSSAKFMRTGSPAVATEQIDPGRIYPAGEPSSSPGAPLTIVGFFDFQCPYSKEAYPAARELQSTYGDKVNFVFRNFPLTDMHPGAMSAAGAGECAHSQDKFWQMSDKLFNSQNFDEQEFKLYAQQIGLDEKKFTDCLNSYQGKGQVLKDMLDGQMLGVGGTPTWFINNEKIEGAIPTDIFKKLIDYLLNKQKP